MIGVDWGTSSLRAFRLAPDGALRDRREAPHGVMHVQDGRFADVLGDVAGDWLRDGEDRVLLSGMIGSRQGWREAAYLPCPAAIRDLAGALTPVRFPGATVAIVPGLISADAGGVPEVMRGEETQIAGVMDAIGGGGTVCLPGTHSKWARIEGGRVVGFATHMTGEAFGTLRDHTILGRLMTGDAEDGAAFDRGVARSAEAGGLLHHLFGARTLVLTGHLDGSSARSYLSGLLIGHEIRAALADGIPAGPVHLVGAAFLARLYARALSGCGAAAIVDDSDAAIRGLFRIGALAWG